VFRVVPVKKEIKSHPSLEHIWSCEVFLVSRLISTVFLYGTQRSTRFRLLQRKHMSDLWMDYRSE